MFWQLVVHISVFKINHCKSVVYIICYTPHAYISVTWLVKMWSHDMYHCTIFPDSVDKYLPICWHIPIKPLVAIGKLPKHPAKAAPMLNSRWKVRKKRPPFCIITTSSRRVTKAPIKTRCFDNLWCFIFFSQESLQFTTSLWREQASKQNSENSLLHSHILHGWWARGALIYESDVYLCLPAFKRRKLSVTNLL